MDAAAPPLPHHFSPSQLYLNQVKEPTNVLQWLGYF